ncbi:hypothetical protein MRB53_040845 [Persea americana]|nr:hypothetical protein MRB53_040845 [Persea americana]
MPKLAVCQHIPGSDIEANFRTVERLVREAAAQGADLAVLPEFASSLPHEDPDNDSNWVDDDGTFLSRYRDLARECHINLVPGTIPEWDGKDVVNTAVFIDRREPFYIPIKTQLMASRA